MNEQQDARRWVVLAVGLLGLTAGCAAQYGLAFLIPALRAEGLTLEAATLLVTAPIAGILCTLIAWGAAADRWGERRILTLGLAMAGLAELGAASVDEPIQRWLLLFLVGASSASIHAASGRLILGWFGAPERGLAMGIRQMGQPLGVGLAAIVLPPLAVSGVGTALTALGVALPRALPPSSGSSSGIRFVPVDAAGPAIDLAVPRGSFLWRIHAAQRAARHPAVRRDRLRLRLPRQRARLGASPMPARTARGARQLAGAASRLLVGWWSDRAGSRLGPMRLVALAIGLAMAALATLACTGASVAVAGPGDRRDRHGHVQWPRLHGGGRAGRTPLGRPGAGRPEHLPERDRHAGRDAARAPHRRRRRGSDPATPWRSAAVVVIPLRRGNADSGPRRGPEWEIDQPFRDRQLSRDRGLGFAVTRGSRASAPRPGSTGRTRRC